jgi:iron(II)-dependent oxidoreductase
MYGQMSVKKRPCFFEHMKPGIIIGIATSLFFLFAILTISLLGQEKKGIFPDEISSFSDKDISDIDLSRHYAFIIGINRYDNIRGLHNAESDSMKIVDLLVQKFGYKKENVKTLYNSEANSWKIQKRLDIYKNELEKGDSLFMYFSGHGFKTDNPEEGYWIPSDVGVDLIPKGLKFKKSDNNDNRKLMGSSRVKFSHREIMQFMGACRATHIFVVADSCHSTIFFEESKGKPDIAPNEDLLLKKSRHLLGAGDFDVSDGMKGKSSPFARSFIEVLKKGSFRNGFISATKIISDVEEEFINLKDNIQIPKGGRVFDSGDEKGEFYFFLESRVFIEQMKIDYRTLIKRLVRSAGEDKKLEWCDNFLTKYKKIPDGIPKAYSEEFKRMLADIVTKRERLKQRIDIMAIDIDLLECKTQGDLNFKKGNYNEAKRCYERILERLPDDLYAKEKIDECENSQYKKTAAITLYENGQYDKALTYLNQLVKISPSDENVKEKLRNIISIKLPQLSKEGDRFFSRGEYIRAIEKYKEALNLEPTNKDLHEKIKKSERMQQMEERSGRIESLLKKSNSFFKTGRYHEAIRLYKQLLIDMKGDPSIQRKIKKCEEEIDFNTIKNEKAGLTLELYLDFFKKYPNSSHLAALQNYLKENDSALPHKKYWHESIYKNDKGYYEYKFGEKHTGHIMIYIPEKSFWIDKYEISNRQFERLLKEEGTKIPQELDNQYIYICKKDECPILVEYKYAGKYCEKYGFRLPKEDEWEYVAGKGQHIYPWGNELPDENGIYRANYDSMDSAGNEKDGFVGTAPVKEFKKFSSPFGAVNMAGNVWEWVNGGILKGGGFYSDKEDLTIIKRNIGKGGIRKGFRCIKDEK